MAKCKHLFILQGLSILAVVSVIFGIIYTGKISLKAETAGEQPIFTFAAITDPHIGLTQDDPNWSEAGSKASDILRAAVNDINNRTPQVPFTVVLGDISDGGTLAQFQEAKIILDGLNSPYYVMMGNHDNARPDSKQNFKNTFGLVSTQYSFDYSNFHFSIMDCTLVSPINCADPTIVDWLRADLAATTKPTFVLNHFNHWKYDGPDSPWYPTEIGPPSNDSNLALRQVMEESGKVILELNGHAHMNRYTFNRVGYATLGAINTYPAEIRYLEVYSDQTISRPAPISDQNLINYIYSLASRDRQKKIDGDINNKVFSISHPQPNFKFYKKADFDFIREYTTFPDNEQIGELSLEIAPGQKQTLSLAILPLDNFSNIEIGLSDLVSESGTIPAANLDLRVAKVWWRAGNGSYVQIDDNHQPLPGSGLEGWSQDQIRNLLYVPELLLKDDSFDFSSQQWRWDNLPNLRLTGNVNTNFIITKPKQLFLIVNVPPEAQTGFYWGKINIYQSGIPLGNLSVKLRVLPFNLATSNKTTGIFSGLATSEFDLSLGDEEAFDRVTLENWQKSFQDIADHGFNSTMLYSQTPSDLDRDIKFLKQIGLDKTVITHKWYPNTTGRRVNQELLDTFINNGLDPFFYGTDEPMLHNSLSQAFRDLEVFHNSGAKGMISDVKEGHDWLATQGQTPDLSNYHTYSGASYPEFNNYLVRLQAGEPKNNRLETFYFFADQERPKMQRYTPGFFFYNHRELNGIFPYVYQNSFGNPYDDWDCVAGSTRCTERNSIHPKDYLAAYPSANGPIATIQWEALREGFNDARYAQTLKQLLDQKRASFPEIVNPIEIAFDQEMIKYNPIYSETPGWAQFDVLSNLEFEQSRSKIIRWLEELIEATTPKVKITKTADRSQAQTGETVAYTLNYEILIDTASNIIIDDVIPFGSSYIDGSATNGGQFDGNKIVWNLGNLAPGVSGQVQFQVRLE